MKGSNTKSSYRGSFKVLAHEITGIAASVSIIYF